MSPESLTVLGSGVVGLSVAREARLRGIPFQLLEARELGAGCTPSATGVLKAPEHRRSPYLDLRHLSWEDWPLLAKSLYEESEGLEVGFSLCGGLDLRDRTMKDPQQAIEKLYGSGGSVRVVPEAELKSTLPRVRRPLGDAVFIEHQAVVDPGALLKALTLSCQNLGAQLQSGLGSITLCLENGKCSEDGKVVLKSETDIKLHEPSEKHPLVIAAGWESGFVVDGVREGPLPLEPVRGEAIALDIPAPPHIVTFDALLPDHPDPAGNRSRFSWIPAPDGSSWFGNSVGAKDSANARDPQPTQAGKSHLVAAAETIFGDEVGSLVRGHWAGLRPKATRHGGPLLGRVKDVAGVWMATGHYRTGLLIGPLTARWVVEAILGEREIPENFEVPCAGDLSH